LQSLGIFKNLIFIRKRTLLIFWPIWPSPARAGPLCPAGRRVHAQPIRPKQPWRICQKMYFFDFAHSGNDAFTLSHHCHVGPAHQLHPLPHADRSHSCHRFFSSPQATLHRPASNIEVPIEVITQPRVDSVHGIIHYKIIHYSRLFQRFCKKVPRLLGNQHVVQILHSDPWFLKNNSKRVPSLGKIHKNSPETSKFHIFSTATPNLVILAPKSSGSLLLSFYAFI
jgi:hypothetical protein